MVRRTSKSDRPHDIPTVLRGLAACRNLMIKVQTQVKPMGACFYGAAMVNAAIDAFATFLTGQRYYLANYDNSGFIVPQPVDPDEVFDLPPSDNEDHKKASALTAAGRFDDRLRLRAKERR